MGQPGQPGQGFQQPAKKPGFGSRLGGALKSTVVRIVVTVAVLAGIGAIASLWDADRDDSGQVVDEGNADVNEVRPGDCFEVPSELDENPEGTEVDGLHLVPCDKEHDAEMYAEVIVDGGDDAPFPGQQALDDQAELQCIEPFTAYVGIPIDSSNYYYNWLTPTDDSWTKGKDRQIMCILQTGDGSKMTGSAKGSNK